MNTPKYYKGLYYKYEAHEVIEDFCGDNYNLGVALAYLMRCGKKEDNDISKDIQKAIDHLNFELKRQKHLKKDNTDEMLEKFNKLYPNGTSTY